MLLLLLLLGLRGAAASKSPQQRVTTGKVPKHRAAGRGARRAGPLRPASRWRRRGARQPRQYSQLSQGSF